MIKWILKLLVLHILFLVFAIWGLLYGLVWDVKALGELFTTGDNEGSFLALYEDIVLDLL